MRKIRFLDQIGGDAAFAFAVEGYLALMRDGHVDPGGMFVHWEDRAIVCMDGQEIIGIIDYVEQKWRRFFFVNISYVKPMYRRDAVFTEMWQELIVTAQHEDITTIEGGTHVNNTAMLAACAKLHRDPTYVMHRFAVPPRPWGGSTRQHRQDRPDDPDTPVILPSTVTTLDDYRRAGETDTPVMFPSIDAGVTGRPIIEPGRSAYPDKEF